MSIQESDRDLNGAIFESTVLFEGLDKRVVDGLVQLADIVQIGQGEVLFAQGDQSDGCYFVIEGALKVSVVSHDGEEALLAVVRAGDVIGEMGLIGGTPRSANVAALKNCTLAFIVDENFTRFADANPSVYRHMLEIMCMRLRASNETLTAFQLLPPSGRLAQVLLRLAEGFGKPLVDGRVLIHQKFTQSDFARMTGTARENVNRQLKIWRSDCVVSRVSGYYCIEDTERLAEISKI